MEVCHVEAQVRRAVLAAVVRAGVAGAAGASERCTDTPKSTWLSQEAIAAKIKEQGLDVSRVETKRSCYEVKAKDTQGRRLELTSTRRARAL